VQPQSPLNSCYISMTNTITLQGVVCELYTRCIMNKDPEQHTRYRDKLQTKRLCNRVSFQERTEIFSSPKYQYRFYGGLFSHIFSSYGGLFCLEWSNLGLKLITDQQLRLMYFNSKPPHVSSRLAAHHQEDQLCINSSWYNHALCWLAAAGSSQSTQRMTIPVTV